MEPFYQLGWQGIYHIVRGFTGLRRLHTIPGLAYNSMAMAHLLQFKYDEALRGVQKSIAIQTKALGNKHVELGKSRRALALTVTF